VIVATLKVLAATSLLAGCTERDDVGAREALQALDVMAARAPWPGFDPSAVPIALFDDRRTYLFRHPSPPEDFRGMRGRADAWVMDSVHPAMRANTTVDLGGQLVATVFVDPVRAWTPDELARLLVHETFHVFQRRRHAEWAPNEVDLFTYPVAALEPLHLRRLETAALRRALIAPDSVRRLCWAREALETRAARYRALSAADVAYERGTELWEGLARYVERRASGEPSDAVLPPEGFPPADVRERGYQIGRAFAHLLDAISPGWQQAVEDGTVGSLEAALADALAAHEAAGCRLSPDERRRARAVAADDIQTYEAENRRLRERFESRLGYSLAIEAPEGAPLWPERFDPLNVRVLDRQSVLHQRWIRLGRDGESIEVLARQALTRAAGEHPLFEGVSGLLVTGLRNPLEVEAQGDTVHIRGDGVTATLVAADIERDGPRTVARLRAPETPE
jgi:hypothetical protein